MANALFGYWSLGAHSLIAFCGHLSLTQPGSGLTVVRARPPEVSGGLSVAAVVSPVLQHMSVP